MARRRTIQEAYNLEHGIVPASIVKQVNSPLVRMANLDYYAAECRRDVELARELGYRGAVFPVIPSSGGFDLADCARLRAPGPTSARRVKPTRGHAAPRSTRRSRVKPHSPRSLRSALAFGSRGSSFAVFRTRGGS